MAEQRGGGGQGRCADVGARTIADAGVADRQPVPRLRARGLRLVAPGAGRCLLDHADLRFDGGEIWCLVGPNGAGKTTLLETLAGFRAPQAGEVLLAGRPLRDWPLTALARQRAFLPQQSNDAFGATVFDTVLLGRHPYLNGWGWERQADRQAVAAALADVEMTTLAGRDVRRLSGGERQRVALAAMFAQSAPLMLCDEPLAHLDLTHQVNCLRLLQNRVRRNGDTVIFVCHDLNLARVFASHALLLDGNGGWQAGAAREILTPALLSAAFAFPIVLVGDGEDAVLAPDLLRRR